MSQLKEVLLQGHESKDLDYKGPCKWDEKESKKACCEIVKDILAMANTLGGYIVIGVSEQDGRFVWEGLTREQGESFETTRINRFLQNYADPPINTLLNKVEHDGRLFAFIEIPRFSDTPHICQKDYPGVLAAPALYVRTDSNESAPLRSSSDFRSIIEHAIRNRSDHLLTSMRAILTGTALKPPISDKARFEQQFLEALGRWTELNPFPEKKYEGYREASFHPSIFQEERFDFDGLESARKRAYANFHGWPFIFWHEDRTELSHVISDGIETYLTTQDFGGNDRCDFWRMHRSGFLYHRVLMREEGYTRSRNMAPALDVGDTARYVAEAIYCLGRIYEGVLQDDEEIALKIRVLGVKGRVLKIFDESRGPLLGEHVSAISEIAYEKARPLAEWRAGTVDLAVAICKEIFLKFNWREPNLTAIREIIETNFTRSFS